MAKFTFVSHQGSSVNDYFISSIDFVSYVSSLYVGEKAVSDHFPLELSCRTKQSVTNDVSNQGQVKYVWNDVYEFRFLDNLKRCLDLSLLLDMLNSNVDRSLSKFVDCLLD